MSANFPHGLPILRTEGPEADWECGATEICGGRISGGLQVASGDRREGALKALAGAVEDWGWPEVERQRICNGGKWSIEGTDFTFAGFHTIPMFAYFLGQIGASSAVMLKYNRQVADTANVGLRST